MLKLYAGLRPCVFIINLRYTETVCMIGYRLSSLHASTCGCFFYSACICGGTGPIIRFTLAAWKVVEVQEWYIARPGKWHDKAGTTAFRQVLSFFKLFYFIFIPAFFRSALLKTSCLSAFCRHTDLTPLLTTAAVQRSRTAAAAVRLLIHSVTEAGVDQSATPAPYSNTHHASQHSVHSLRTTCLVLYSCWARYTTLRAEYWRPNSLPGSMLQAETKNHTQSDHSLIHSSISSRKQGHKNIKRHTEVTKVEHTHTDTHTHTHTHTERERERESRIIENNKNICLLYKILKREYDTGWENAGSWLHGKLLRWFAYRSYLFANIIQLCILWMYLWQFLCFIFQQMLPYYC